MSLDGKTAVVTRYVGAGYEVAHDFVMLGAAVTGGRVSGGADGAWNDDELERYKPYR